MSGHKVKRQVKVFYLFSGVLSSTCSEWWPRGQCPAHRRVPGGGGVLEGKGAVGTGGARHTGTCLAGALQVPGKICRRTRGRV